MSSAGVPRFMRTAWSATRRRPSRNCLPFRRLYEAAVDEDLSATHLDEHGAEAALPHVSLHAVGGPGQVQLRTGLGADENFRA